MSKNQENKADLLENAISDVWMNAGFNEPNCGIVPLYELIGAYPIVIEEIEYLTYKRAAEFLIAETGQPIAMPLGGDQQISGFMYAYMYCGSFYGCILLEKRDPITRRRFSAAHELGHYVLHFIPQLKAMEKESISDLVFTEGLVYGEQKEVQSDVPSGQVLIEELIPRFMILDNESMEIEANQFAAELLMPKSACMTLINQYRTECGGMQDILVKRLTTEFLVSREAMKWRLSNLKRLLW
jgi:Zn-dependent peptidase ImmA (M78 family)